MGACWPSQYYPQCLRSIGKDLYGVLTTITGDEQESPVMNQQE